MRQGPADGNERTNAIAPGTLGEVRAAVGHSLLSGRLPARGLFGCGNMPAGQGWRYGIL
jgi:hypothetical protein